MNKLGANMTTIKTAENLYTRLQGNEKANLSVEAADQEALGARPAKGTHIDLSAG